MMVFVVRFSPFLLSLPLFSPRQWAGNPAKGNKDYCNGNGALESSA
jgi:hypothetical protein